MIDALAKATYIYIATVRKDGTQSKAAPIWFITTPDNDVLIETALQDQVIAEYPKKYLLAWLGIARPSHAKLDRGQIVVIRISPTRELPAGFQSSPGTPAPLVDPK